MNKKKFCVVGVDNDIDSYIRDNKSNYIGLITNFKEKKYSIGNIIGKENLNDWLRIKKKYNPRVIIAIDDNLIRENLTKKIYKDNVVNIIFKNSDVDKEVLKKIKKRKGIFIQKLCFISSNVDIENGVRINVGCQIHHDVSIGRYSTVAPGSVILGSVKIGHHTFIGANSTIRQNIKIGNNVIIGAGATVIENVPNNQIVAGNPAKKIDS